jgi:hypothetical protein
MSEFKLLEATEKHMSNKIRLPVLKEEFFYPTEASVELEPEHPGEKNIIGTCMRAAYFRYSGAFQGDPSSDYLNWTAMSGKAWEEKLIETWKEMGLFVGNNIKFRSKEHHISGELDAVIYDPENPGDMLLIECKTYYGYDATKELKGFFNRKTKFSIPGKPKDAHLLQILIYLHLHEHIFSKGKLIYIDRTCKDNVEFNISLVKEGDNTYPVINGVVSRRFSMEQIYERYAKLKEFVDAKKLPPRDYDLNFSTEKIEREFAAGNISKTKYEEWQKKKTTRIMDWNCSYCRYRTECEKND